MYWSKAFQRLTILCEKKYLLLSLTHPNFSSFREFPLLPLILYMGINTAIGFCFTSELLYATERSHFLHFSAVITVHAKVTTACRKPQFIDSHIYVAPPSSRNVVSHVGSAVSSFRIISQFYFGFVLVLLHI